MMRKSIADEYNIAWENESCFVVSCSFFCLYCLTFRQTQTLLALWLQTRGPAYLFWHKGIVRTRWLKDSKREREGKETVRQTKRARPTGSHSRREEHAVTNYCAERCTLSPHISTFSFFRGKARNEKLVFSRQFSQMLLSKCYFLSKNKWIKGKQKKRQRSHPSCKQSSVLVSQQSLALPSCLLWRWPFEKKQIYFSFCALLCSSETSWIRMHSCLLFSLPPPFSVCTPLDSYEFPEVWRCVYNESREISA